MLAKKKNCAVALMIAAGASIIIMLSYCFFAGYYHSHIFKGTVVNGLDMSNMTAAQAKKALEIANDNYMLTITGRDGLSRMITSGEIDREYVDDQAIDDLISYQNTFAWIFETAHRREVQLKESASFDHSKAETHINALLTTAEPDYVSPENARLELDENGLFSVVEEVDGTTLNSGKLRTAVMKALADGKRTLDLDAAGVYEAPSIRADNETLNARKDAMNKYLAVRVTYPFGDTSEYLNASTILPLLTGQGADISISQEAVEELVDSWCRKYNTLDYDFVITNHAGVDQVIPAGGTYGWRLDRSAMITSVLTALENGTQGEIEPIWDVEQYWGRENNGLGLSYVEVDMGEQYMYVYQDGELAVATPVVTGLPANGRATAEGCYESFGKDMYVTLGSYDVQGYESPVKYWIAFNGGQGIHDASWRWEGEFGGDTWVYNGSHGCVNVPSSMMGAVYEHVYESEPVVLYY